MAASTVKPDAGTTDPGKPTTIKLSTAVRDRIKSYGGETYEHTIVEALDALDEVHVAARIDAYARWRASLTEEQQLQLDARDARIDAAFDAVAD